jgi:hypothetical protein
MPSLPWGVLILLLLAIVIYLQGLQGALAAWRLSTEKALLILLALIAANYFTISLEVSGAPVNLHVGSFALLAVSLVLWYLQGGGAKWLWLIAAWVLTIGLVTLHIFTQYLWTGTPYVSYWLFPLLIATAAAILTRNMAGVLFLATFSMVAGEMGAALFQNIVSGTWLTLGSKTIYDMAVLSAVTACLFVAAAQLLALSRWTLRQGKSY